ncbi:toll-like receptor 13 [Hyla sarda]|uniref:toll-like receptor 13 n=1 Tax=Hyla sarda TaxID=327740 RepID=UPI0024C3349D|nr:toll-like receptor 13 [Hyla sarda]
MDAVFYLVCGAFFISYSPCLGMLRKHCDIIEHEYFDTYNSKMSIDFGGFDKLNFSLGAVCTFFKASTIEHLDEVPVTADWLYLEIYTVSLKSQAFSHLTHISYIYISGYFVISPVVFFGLKKLSVLWLQQRSIEIIEELDLNGLSMLQELKLSGTNFSSLNKSIFDNLHQLKQLILESNSIDTLSSVTQYLPKLESLKGLSIINNDMRALRETDCLMTEFPTGKISPIHFNITYLNLDGFQTITLENNSLCNFPRLSYFKPGIHFSILDALKNSGIQVVDSFSFFRSQFTEFHICMYVSLFQIQELELANNDIGVIDTSNGSCSKLRVLDLSFNNIKNVTALEMKKLKKLMEINLSNNKITNIEICLENTTMELVNLNLSFNYLTSLTQHQFKCLELLKALSLNDNKIQMISKYSFDGMKTLEVLYLDNNDFYSLAEFAFAGLFSLKHLTLNENFLEEIDDWAFKDLGKLEEIALDFESMESMWWSRDLVSLKKMSLRTLDVFLYLESQFFNHFDAFESLSIETQNVFIDSCDEFPFYKVKYLSLINIIDFFCELEPGIALEKFTNLEKIYLKADVQSKNSILDSHLKNFSKLSFFHFENTNSIVDGSPVNVDKLFLGLENLQTLHLVNLGIEDYSSSMLFHDLKSVKFLMIEHEKIYIFPDNMFTHMVSLKYVFLPETRFSCKCDLSWLVQWMAYEKQVSFLDFYNKLCFVNAQIEDSHLVSFLEDNCNSELGFIAFIATLVSTLMFMCISLYYESIWWYILYIMYKIKAWLKHRYRERDHYEYDVFVSYNTHNEPWVIEQLLPNLEQTGPPFFKVCIHNRDFEIGRDIVENIVDSIYSSRWTICVITRSYLQSNWCSMEIRMATYRLVAESKDSLILLFLDNIPTEELQQYHKLTKIIEKKTYLKWPGDGDGQQLFWARLRSVIASHAEDNQEP